MREGTAPETPVPPAGQVTASQAPAADKTTIDVEAKNKS
jgi:hypothetical protein